MVERLEEEGIQTAAAALVLATFDRSIANDVQKLEETLIAVKACADNGTTLCPITNPTAYYRWLTIIQLGERGIYLPMSGQSEDTEHVVRWC